jgi:hypothetical protein
MFRIYEIRNKATHRIEFISLFKSTEKPDDAFRADPISQSFANRYDLYINIPSESFESYDKAIAFLHQKSIDYKLLKVANEEARMEATQSEGEIPKAKVARPRKKKE